MAILLFTGSQILSNFRNFSWEEAGQLLAGVFFIVLSARVSITPSLLSSPVPITGQSLAVLLVAGLLGPVKGNIAILLYLIFGSAGLPVFADGESGIEKLAGPGGGYLVGFIPAAYLAGWLAKRVEGSLVFLKLTGAMMLSTLVILLCGWLRLAFTLGLSQAFSTGIVPYLLGALIKIVTGALVLWILRRAGATAGSEPQKDISPV